MEEASRMENSPKRGKVLIPGPVILVALIRFLNQIFSQYDEVITHPGKEIKVKRRKIGA